MKGDNKNHGSSNNQNQSPDFWLSFLQWFCPSKLYEGIEGDLLEQFERDKGNLGVEQARRRFVWNVIKFFRPGILVRHQFSVSMQHLYNIFDLTKIYLRISWRNILRYKSISLINIIGLSVSMSVGLLILMVIKNRLDYDTFHPQNDRLYRITTLVTQKSGEDVHYASSPQPLGRSLKENYPLVDEVLTITPFLQGYIRKNNEEFYMKGAFADASFFDVLGFKLIAGNPSHALTRPHSIVLSEDTALKFFGRQTALDETLTINGYGDFKVTGIIAKQNTPSQFEFEAYASMATVTSPGSAQSLNANDNWKSYTTAYTYVRIKPGSHEAMLRALKETGIRALKEVDFPGSEKSYLFQARTIDDVPFSDLLLEPGRGRSKESLMILSLPGVILLLLAVFNYTNMTVARAFSRAKEIGVRRIAGASRSQLFFQLIIESIVLAVISVVFAGLLATYIPVNGSFENSLPATIDYSFMLWFFIFAVIIGCLTGFFPALALSGIKPMQALKNLGGKKGKKLSWKKGLIVIQFSLSLAFLIVLLVIYEQNQFQIKSDYGFARKDIIHVKPGPVKHNVLMKEIEGYAGVERVSASSNPIFTWGNRCRVKSQNDPTWMEYYSVDDAYMPVYDLTLVAGKNFSSDLSDKHEQHILLNEKAVEALKLGTPHEALGQSLLINDTLSLHVTGIVKDFNAHPFKFSISPLAFRYKPDEFNMLTVKTSPSSLQTVLKHITRSWNKLAPDYPFSYSIFDDEFNERQAHADDLKMIGSLAVIAIIISCLGLLGVVMYNTQSRTKEIGIRKVMGAYTYQILVLLSWNFLKLLLISACIAMPLGYCLGELVLQHFVYRTELGVGILGLGFLLIMTVGLITIGSQTIRAAMSNPVDTLRYE